MIKPGKKPFKKALVGTVLFILGRGFQSIARFDTDVKKEINQWEESFSIMFEIMPKGPYMSLQKRNGRLKYMGLTKTNADLIITFKNIEAAFLIFTAQLSTAQGYAQHRISVKGDIEKAMSIIRCLNIVQRHLFPRIIARKILKRMPKMTLRRWGIRVYTYFIGIPLGI